MKVGDQIKVCAYKHDGTLNSISYDTTVLEITDERIVCGNYHSKIMDSDGRSYTTKEIAILFFYKKDWYNIICQFKKYGIFYYCNIATPFLIEDNSIKYIDYDLDLRVFPDGTYKILDKNEYIYHKKMYNYTEQLDFIIKNELSKLIKLKESNKNPFTKEEILKYKNIFLNLKLH